MDEPDALEMEAAEHLVALEERRAQIAADPTRTMHACALGWPEIPSDAMGAGQRAFYFAVTPAGGLCGRMGLAEELTEDLGLVTCLDCLRTIAEAGQRRAQVDCALALTVGQWSEQAARALAEFEAWRHEADTTVGELFERLRYERDELRDLLQDKLDSEAALYRSDLERRGIRLPPRAS